MYIFVIEYLSNSFLSFRLEELNEKRSGVVQMVKLAEKERESLEVKYFTENLSDLALTFHMNSRDYICTICSTRVSRMKQKTTCLRNCHC